MRRLTGLLVIAAGTASLLSGPAHAAEPQVNANFVYTAFHKVGAGWIASVSCRTVAVPSDPQVVVVTTTATCSINDTADSGAMPGPVAVAGVTAAATPLFVFCVSGTATFLDTVTSDTFTIAVDPKCVTFEA